MLERPRHYSALAVGANVTSVIVSVPTLGPAGTLLPRINPRPREGGDPEPHAHCSTLWTPAFAGERELGNFSARVQSPPRAASWSGSTATRKPPCPPR